MTAHSRWYGDRAKRLARQGAAEGLRAGIGLMFEATQARVPRDTDELAASGRTEVDEAGLQAEIHYGEGLPDPRAVIIHEKPEIQHDQGEAKYVEGPMRELAPAAAVVIAAALRRRLG